MKLGKSLIMIMMLLIALYYAAHMFKPQPVEQNAIVVEQKKQA